MFLLINFARWYDKRSTLNPITWIVLLVVTVGGIASMLATRRRLLWESREY